jgi:hypothetical protein
MRNPAVPMLSATLSSFKKSLVAVSHALLACSLLAGCLFSGNGGDSKGSASAGRIALVPALDGGSAGTAKVGASGTDGLESFQVAVSHILLAKDLQTSGSGWSGLEGPLPLYSNDFGDFNAVDTAMARSEAFRSNYIDFCSRSSLERLATSQPFTLRDTGSYNWVVVNWAPFFKVRATIPLGGGDTLRTHDGPISRHLFPNSTDAFYYITRSAAPLTQGPSEEALVRKNNGGTWFRFLRPLRLAEADLDSAATVADTVGHDSSGNAIVNMMPAGRWNVLLVFNPRDLLFGGLDDSSNSSIQGDIRSPDDRAYFNVPFLKATAVPYREGEAVMRETYEFSVAMDQAWASGTYGMRLELYLIGDNVVAATVHSYPIDGNFAPPEVPAIFFAEEDGSGALDLQDWNRSAVFDGFVRKNAAGQTGTVLWNPSTHAQEARTLEYTLAEIRRMN